MKKALRLIRQIKTFTVCLILLLTYTVKSQNLPYKTERTALVTALNGLNMRQYPDINAPIIAKVAYKEEVMVLEGFRKLEKSIEQEMYYEDTEERIRSQQSFDVSIKMEEYYGHWRKINRHDQEGWVFSAWLRLIEVDPSIDLLNEIPQEHLELNPNDTSELISYDCFGGLSGLDIQPLGLLNYPYPLIIFGYGQDSDIYLVDWVKKEGDIYIIQGRNTIASEERRLIYLEPQAGSQYKIITWMDSNLYYVPTASFSGKLYVDCYRNP
ncbi:SH3 domain-containing protein [Flagellimonas sp.]|uniref:SH3 domain-containing protein n=1 Tax=Flagellimonas sp. TaxID=2058762 RepID=UPI003BA96BB9